MNAPHRILVDGVVPGPFDVRKELELTSQRGVGLKDAVELAMR